MSSHTLFILKAGILFQYFVLRMKTTSAAILFAAVAG